MGINIDLNGKTALITGATRGIGKAIADKFLDAEVQVVLTGTKQNEIEQLAAANKNPHIQWLLADFSTQNGIDSFIHELKHLILYLFHPQCLKELNSNLFSSFNLLQYILKLLLHYLLQSYLNSHLLIHLVSQLLDIFSYLFYSSFHLQLHE